MKPYYQHSGITIYNCDNRELLPTLSGIDLVITSPPYNMGNTTGGGLKQYQGHYSEENGMTRRGGASKWAACAMANGYGECEDNLPHAEYVAWQKEVLRLCWAALSPAGAIYYNHKVRILGGIAITPLEYNPGLPLRQIITWKRAGGINHTAAFYLPVSEWICLFAKPDFRLSHHGAGADGDVWEINQESGTPHPAPFPLELPARILRTTKSQTVLDPFCGSGTTLVAAAHADVTAIGCEVSERFCEMAARRVDAALCRDGLFAESVQLALT